MKVENGQLAGTAAGGTTPPGAVDRTNGARGSAPGSAASGDRVELSASAAGIGALLSLQAGARADRVASLARDVQAGRYRPNASETSRALVAQTLGAMADSRAGGAPK